MKRLLFLLFASLTFGQNLISLEVGNQWVYDYFSSGNGHSLLEKTIIEYPYTTQGGIAALVEVYQIYDNQKIAKGVEYWYIDSVKAIISNDFFSSDIYIVYNDTLDESDIGNYYQFTSIIEKEVLGKMVTVQHFYDFYDVMSSVWTNTDYAKGLGLIRASSQFSNDTGGTSGSRNEQLIYAKIDGVEYGKSTNITESTFKPELYTLEQNYPNPFNPSTTISFSLAEAGHTSLKVYNILGKEVAQIVNQNLEIGHHNYSFNATGLASGIYFYSLSSNGNVQTKKMTILK